MPHPESGGNFNFNFGGEPIGILVELLPPD